jgi:hypothetical protein
MANLAIEARLLGTRSDSRLNVSMVRISRKASFESYQPWPPVLQQQDMDAEV